MIQFKKQNKSLEIKMKNNDNINQIILVKEMIENAEKNIKSAKNLLSQLTPNSQPAAKTTLPDSDEEDSVVEGTFDGENMIGSDGKQYPVPANYASKSKLIEGDTLKLTIAPDGSFIYKQIGPIDRQRIMGTLMKEEDGPEFYVLAEGKSYKVLLASVTYFKAEPGDQVTLVVPTKIESDWGSIENVIKDLNNVATPEGNRVSDVTQENSPDLNALEEELKES